MKYCFTMENKKEETMEKERRGEGHGQGFHYSRRKEC